MQDPAASEKFNKNKDLPNFGSTTIKIMLEEVSGAQIKSSLAICLTLHPLV